MSEKEYNQNTGESVQFEEEQEVVEQQQPAKRVALSASSVNQSTKSNNNTSIANGNKTQLTSYASAFREKKQGQEQLETHDDDDDRFQRPLVARDPQRQQ